jgi:peptidyl-prolyl cis-trans isomerase-like 4
MSVVLETSLGDLIVDLHHKAAPLAARNFLKLCKRKFYNGTLFFNVQKDFLAAIKTQ